MVKMCDNKMKCNKYQREIELECGGKSQKWLDFYSMMRVINNKIDIQKSEKGYQWDELLKVVIDAK